MHPNHGDENSDRVLFSLSDWTHVLAVHAGEPVFHFYLFKVRKNKNLRGVELKIRDFAAVLSDIIYW